MAVNYYINFFLSISGKLIENQKLFIIMTILMEFFLLSSLILFSWFRLCNYYSIVINTIYVPFQTWQILFYKQKLANFLRQIAQQDLFVTFSFLFLSSNKFFQILLTIVLIAVIRYFLKTRQVINNWFNFTSSNGSEVWYLNADMVSCFCDHNHSNLRVCDH